MTKVSPTLGALIEQFPLLPPLEQDLLKIMALAFEPLSRADIVKILRHFKIRDSRGRTFTHAAVKPFIDGLLNLGFLSTVWGGSSLTRLMVFPRFAKWLAVRLSQEHPAEFQRIARALEDLLPLISSQGYHKHVDNYLRLIREICFRVYQNQPEEVGHLLQLGASAFPEVLGEESPLAFICTDPFDPEWFATRHPVIQSLALQQIFYPRLLALKSMEPLAAYWEKTAAGSEDLALKLACRGYLDACGVLQGKIPPPDDSATHSQTVADLLREALRQFLSGAYEKSLELYETALESLRKHFSRRNLAIFAFSGLFYPLVLCRVQPDDYRKKLRTYLDNGSREVHPLRPCFQILQVMEKVANHDLAGARENLQFALMNPLDPLALLFAGMVAYWYFPNKLSLIASALRRELPRVQKLGYHWVAMEFAGLLQRIEGTAPAAAEYRQMVESLSRKVEFTGFLKMFAPAEPWELKLKALMSLQSPAAGSPAAETRVVWMLSFRQDFRQVSIQPKEQKRKKNGEWTAGRKIALKRLQSGEVPGMTPQDRRVADTIRRQDYYYGNPFYYFDEDKALLALIGHPLLFLEGSHNTPIELVKGEPTLLVEPIDDEFEIRFAEAFYEIGVRIVQESPTRYRVIEIKPEHLEIGAILDFKPLRVPGEARDRLLGAIGNISRVVTVQSGLAGEHQAIPVVAADSTIRMHLLPFGNGFRLDMLVRPFGDAGAYFRPGHGQAHLIAEIKGQRVQTRRDLTQEQENAARVLKACPLLLLGDAGTHEWIFDSPEACLDVLLELEGIRDQAVIEWPEGEKLRIRRKISFDQLSLRIRRQRDWFELSGKVKLDEGKVLEVQELLDLLESSPGRFVEISDGQFIALTEEFRKALQELQAFSERSKKGLRFNPLLGPIVEEFTEKVQDLKVDAAWRQTLENLKNAETHHAMIPSTLQAELRGYQVEGFRWLARLAKWGVGACLADDMGLGKTVQALAVLLERAAEGPALVVAPASVTTNWISEAHRFAPTLNARLFGKQDRQQTVEELGPFDLLVCSYGLLPNEMERLKKVNWHTIVLDEAQAIKNAATRRSQAAMQLSGNFKMITTGTPVENHLGELWNLFRFLNPGLLGSQKKFTERYAGPIERYQDPEARRRLKRLIQPFILRRLKSEVLQELPPKTEITLTVALSDEEWAFYEALRRRALEKITASDGDTGDKRFQILAEIMRLRRACCHPRLVVPDSPIGSAKLNLFAEVVEELLENRHKALVFSQFVDHLSIVREYLDRKGISYQYLDGSTPTAKRPDIVRAFQAGQGDLFLISLRAGGQGLNLTAADYVIHLDPWWNPAVEDQASDRSHRIGQQHPVTIYRLVTENTIEEKIIALHHSKRDLADSLLAGTDVSGKISAEELLRIIREA